MEASFYPCNQPELNEKHTVGRFKGALVVVAGGASGIGFAAACRFVNDGATVAILDLNKTMGESAVSHIQSRRLTGSIKYYFLDITDPKGCEDAAKRVASENGGQVHHVVNTAAYFGSKGENATMEDWRKSFEVNVAGYSNIVQACLPYMSRGSSIVNLSSTAGRIAQPGRWTYAATKAAISALTRGMALDLSKRGIRVNAVSPAWVWSPEQAKASPDGSREAMSPYTSAYHMLGREAETSEVAGVITFLSSKDAGFVTGSDYIVDGGYTAMGPERHGDATLFAGTSAD